MDEVDVTTEIMIRRHRDQVAAFASDPANATLWYRNITSATSRTPPPIVVGSLLDFTARFLGRTLAYTYEVTEHEPGRRLVQRTAGAPFAMETTYTWEDMPEGTKMILRNRGEPSGFSGLAAPAIATAMRRANRADLRRLREYLERSTATPQM